jgi:hypothetical protein
MGKGEKTNAAVAQSCLAVPRLLDEQVVYNLSCSGIKPVMDMTLVRVMSRMPLALSYILHGTG